MERKEYMPILLKKFEEWYNIDTHSTNEDYYSETLTKENLISMSKDNFIDFFYNFYENGGKIQSLGHIHSKQFKSEILKLQYNEFKSFVLEPFENNFNEKEWLFGERGFKYFTKGTITIFLNRVNKYKYSIFNDKTIDTLNALGYNVKKQFNDENYSKVQSIQKELINDYNILNNFYKVDALNEFIIGKPKFIYELDELKIISSNETPEESSTVERIRTNIERIVRDTKIIIELKRKYENKCQICGFTIELIGKNYSEGHHLKPLGKPHYGPDINGNIIIVCPNCHVKLDYFAIKIENLVINQHILNSEYINYHNDMVNIL